MDLNEITIFAAVVQAGSFTAAARKLSMPKSTVSRKVAELETRLGAQLLQRTTRKLNLTDAGRTYALYAERIAADVADATLAVSRLQETPRGLLRVSTVLGVPWLGPPVRSFLERFPLTQIELVCTDRVVDLLYEGFDLAIRAGRLADSSLIARPLGHLRSYVVASPALLKQHGVPQAPQDLSKLPCLVFGAGSRRGNWALYKDGKEVTTKVSSRLTANDFDVLLEAAVAGSGVAFLPAHLASHHLRSGRLIRLLGDWCSPPVPLHAVYPGTRLVPPKVKAFVEHLKEQLTPPPWEVGVQPPLR